MNPRMLTLARESRGLTQSQLAKTTGIGQPILSKAENGIGTLTPERLDLVADALGFPREVLDWDDDIVGLGASAFYHRKQSGLGQVALKRIEAEMCFLLIRLRRLERSVDVEPAHRLPVLDSDGYEPEEAARRVRAAWLVPNGPIHDAVQLVERAGIVVVRMDLGSPKISGLSVKPPDSLPLLVLNEGMPSDRERFTIMHELGHLVMHQIPSDDGEREADRFAAEFLMPAQEIGPYLSGMSIQRAVQLKQYWKTSMASIIRRAHTLGRIDDRKYKSLSVQLNQRGYRKHEPAEPAREEPTILPQVIEAFRDDHGYSDRELANVVGLRIREFHDEFGAPRALRAV